MTDGIEVIVGSQIPYEDRRQVAAALNMLGIASPSTRRTDWRRVWRERRYCGADSCRAVGAGNRADRKNAVLAAREFGVSPETARNAHSVENRSAKKDGTIMASHATIYGDAARTPLLGDKVMTRAATHAAGPYNVEHVKIDCYAMYTNNPPAGAFRGFGVTQSAFAVESNMDEIAHKLEIDPFELRRKNGLVVGSTTSTGQVVRESAGIVRMYPTG